MRRAWVAFRGKRPMDPTGRSALLFIIGPKAGRV
jgi:hypothetical protein